MPATLVLLWCGDCASTQGFEAPPCGADHAWCAGAECRELVCTGCGAAVLVLAPVDLPAGALPAAAEGSAAWALPRSA
ncbi:hypothetical protein EV189_1280 [Motilibacter rhizosphaerae]|uniref:Uncharacterized protein n=1 Tax=Motilibacter rhizosphaerae TaxID=598652 RepID=A0A4Q7NR24_9ACTN|nr:hypothetical protein [Motilibacter rhizosphaerae]RZS89513.1 hypothetical protein EV189_1280 [Motilibacter rhizosphaerae]